MALTQTQVSQLYVSVFGRASEGEANTYWQTDQADMVTTANVMLATDAAKDYFGATLDDNQAFIEFIYENTLGKTYAEDTAGVDYWVAELAGGKSKGEVVTALINAAIDPANAGDAQDQFNNKVEVSNFTADNVATFTDFATFTGLIADVDETAASVTEAKGDVISLTGPGEAFTLTNDTDVATANVFTAPMVHTPDGSDRILSLQDEDILTGTEGRTDNTLNVTMGQLNADEGERAVITPELNNIQVLNLDFTGNANTFDARFSDSLTTINMNKITSTATTATVTNITTAAATLRVADAAAANTNAVFNYQRGVLDGDDDSANIELDDVLANNITQNALGGGANIEGFETVTLNAVNGVDINAFTVNEMETLTITGDSFLDIVALTPTAPITATEYDLLGLPGIANPAAVGLLTLDASAFEGNLTLDITNSLGGFADPANSGATVHGVVTGGIGDDTFWTSANVAATSATNRDVIDGGEGTNTFITTAGVVGNASISNFQSLELRQQAGAQTVDFDAFDENLASVMMRDETVNNGAAVFNLNDLGADLASAGLTLRHSVSEVIAGSDAVVNALLKDASGADDTIAIAIENDRNTTTKFDYTLNFDGDDGDGDAVLNDGAVENVTINDNDTESNVVTLAAVDVNGDSDHTGTVTLNGGVAGQTYQVNATLIADTIEASAQNSNLILTVGDADQTIKLGAGDDLLTFDGLNTFDGNDAITDVGGTDTVRAAFSANVAGTPELAGIENLHIVATANSSLDLANADDLTQLVLMSNEAVDQATEIFTTPIALGQVALTDVITLKNTNLTEINFFGDEDAVVAGTTVAVTQNFNGLTLDNNTGDNVTVNIGAPLTNLTNLEGNGITTYNLGQLTTHGVKELSIVVDNEITAGATTNISNIWDRDLTSLTLSAVGDVNVGTVTGNTVNSNITTVDASAVGGDTTATVKALGNAAVVTLAAGDDIFNALGSAGDAVKIYAGEGDNSVVGTAQSDYIYSGAGNDTIDANRGNNTVQSGAGDDTVAALNGSNTVDLGSGMTDTVTFNYDTAAQLALATNGVAGSGTNASINFVDAGPDGIVGTIDDVTTSYGFAVGDGAELSVKFTGTAFDATSSTLNGRSAIAVTADISPVVEANQSNLVVLTGTTAQTFAIGGGSAADVILDYRTGAAADASAYNVSTGAGNDAIVISQTSTAVHTITGGAGADRVVLSAAAAAAIDTIAIAEADSTAAGWDVISNFAAGTDTIDVSAFTVGTAAALTSVVWADLDADVDALTETVAVAATGEVTIGLTGGGNALIGDDVSVEAVIGYLATNSTTVNDAFWFAYDSDGSGAITAADNAIVFQNLGTDMVVELVGVGTTIDFTAGDLS